MSRAGLRGQLAVLDLGFEPLGAVMGVGVYQLYAPSTCAGVRPKAGSEPLIYPTYEASLSEIWTTVVGRLEAEAHKLGAHGVLGVSVSETRPTPPMYQLQVIGTAFHLPGQRPLARPFLSTLRTDEFVKLLAGGWVPRGLVWSVAAVHVHGWAANPMSQGSTFTNAEMAAPTAGVNLARRRLEHGIRERLQACGATGAVKSTIDLHRVGQACGGGNGLLIDGRMLATGIVHYRQPAAPVGAARNLGAGARHA